MFMEPIEVATAALEPAPRSRSTALKLAVGALFLLVCAMLMLPWTLLIAAWFGMAAGVRAIGALIREMRPILIFSGETVTGR